MLRGVNSRQPYSVSPAALVLYFMPGPPKMLAAMPGVPLSSLRGSLISCEM